MKNKNLFLTLCLMAMTVFGFAQVKKIDNLQVNTTLILPLVTKVQIEALTPTEGSMVYCTDCSPKSIYIFNGFSFMSLSGSYQLSSVFVFTAFPINNKIYKRDKALNSSVVPISGRIASSSSISSISLEVFRNNSLLSTTTEVLSNTDNFGNYTFSFSPTINAELASYKFVVKSNTGQILKQADNIASGDIYIVTGQSNIVTHSSSVGTFPFTNPYIRTFASPNNFTSTITVIRPAALGGIGYWFAEQIVTNENIPVLVLNGGEGGRPISFFQRNDSDPDNTATNYGQLLTRYKYAGYDPTDVTSIVWYQGESDGYQSLSYYTNLFDALYQDWEEDYNPDSYYVFQVHKGCGVSITSQIPEAHRGLQNTYSNLTTISTNGALQGSDNCHYYNTNGYEVLADRLYDILDFKYYDATSSAGIYSPNVSNVKFGDASKTTITFQLVPASDTYTMGSGMEDDFLIENSSSTVTSISLSGNLVTLTLSTAATESNAKLTYLGESQATVPYIFNQNNNGMLSFKDVLIGNF
ncbi:sialate O-acetylesterase [Formosa sp. Hel1_33_131]|uniref:sialate O-acetylesterase n=1 Tax=Formosa sp. Hel1_33_131 TaxID=1336794 RepID=UPI0009F56420|nr:sialate O-acetylesterase [Formosa sp. Hel1_33_131]